MIRLHDVIVLTLIISKSFSIEDSQNGNSRNYHFRFETENGVSREEKVEIVKDQSNNPSLSVHGSYSYTGSDGQIFEVHYVADERGFQPKISFSYSNKLRPTTSPLRLKTDTIKSLTGQTIGR